MTIPEYSLLAGRKTGQVYPTVAAVSSVPKFFDQSYRGSVEIDKRIYRALTAFAIRRWRFWQFSIVGTCVALVAMFFVEVNGWPSYLPLVAVILPLTVVLGPLLGVHDIRKIAHQYSNPEIVYSASCGDESIIWRCATGTYEVRWRAMTACIRRDEINVVSIADSRAICVLPDELLPQAARERIALVGKPRTA